MGEYNSKSKPSRTLLKIAVVLIGVCLLAAIVIPNYNGTHRSSPGRRMNACINNLRQLDAAVQQWALEKNKTNLDTVVTWNDVRPYLGRGSDNSLISFYCPEDRTKQCSNSYTLGDLKIPPKCKINPAHFLQ